MNERDKILEIISKLCKTAPCDEILVSLYKTKRISNRFSSFSIRETVSAEDIEVYIKVSVDKKIGLAVSETLDEERLKFSLNKAIDIAKHSKKNPYYKTFLVNPWEPSLSIPTYAISESLIFENFSHLKKTLAEKKDNLNISGSIVLGEDTLAVSNSRGLSLYQPLSFIYAKILTKINNISGFSSFLSRNINRLDLNKLLEEAKRKCTLPSQPRSIPLGKYKVILKPQAVADLLEWLGYIGFGAKSLFEKRSFLYGRFGQKIMSEKLTIYDDGLEGDGFIIPFDFEGSPKRRIELIENGTAKDVVYDTYYGSIYEKQTSGHAGFLDSNEGPLCANLSIMPGKITFEEMLKSLDNGIYISRFHYINGLLEPKTALMTGLTRDGTFFVADGKLKFPVKNLRFTESMLNAFSNIETVSRERTLTGDPFQSFGAFYVPGLLINSFTFTGISE